MTVDDTTDADAVAELDDPQFRVLNAICLKKMAAVGGVADATGLSVSDTESALETLEELGLVSEAGGQYLPTNDAEPTAEAWASQHYGELRGDDEIERHYERFERINSAFLEAMTSWQQVTVGDKRVPNDHSDPEYDAQVISTIASQVQRLGRILDGLAEHVPRLALYEERFAAAMDQVDDGHTEYVAAPTADSIHNIWFEFHEDLLRILGKEREE